VVSTQFDDDGQEYVITYASRSNNDVGSTNLSHEGEALGVVWLVAHFHTNLYGQQMDLEMGDGPLIIEIAYPM
jgi:hypothetical protein